MIIFDVGANNGSSSKHYAANGHTVYAFEPNEHLFNGLKEYSKEHPTFKPYKVAVSDFEGFASFNVCDKADRGCSSLLDLSDKGRTEWGGRKDMIPVDKVTVDVIRLDKFIEHAGIECIDVFHCDAQGSDLNVLKGLGDHITKIQRGVVEAALKPDILYVNQNSVYETIDYLKSFGFIIGTLHSNDVQLNEVNINFTRV